MLPDEVRLEFEAALEPNDMIPLADAWRIAELATRLEREACAMTVHHVRQERQIKQPLHSCYNALCDAAEAIEARGK